jgi:rhamnosyltransferase
MSRPPTSEIDSITVIIRSRDEAASISRCLDLVLAQRLEHRTVQVIVVDSGSRDGTTEIVRRRGIQMIEIPPASFTFGGALNLGAANATGELLVALSAHAFLRDERWLERLAAPFADPAVACASGDRYRPDGSPLTGPVRQDLALVRAEPEWGYSNGAGAFRASLWRQREFRPELPFCEDREWSRHWLERGYVCVIDPALVVEHDHTHDPVRQIYRRARLEAEGFATFLERPPYGLAELAGDWWSDLRFYDSALRARLSHRRAARLLGTYVGRRATRAP